MGLKLKINTRRNSVARVLLDRSGPYRAKIVVSKKKYNRKRIANECVA